jgi:hypothetical protein
MAPETRPADFSAWGNHFGYFAPHAVFFGGFFLQSFFFPHYIAA